MSNKKNSFFITLVLALLLSAVAIFFISTSSAFFRVDMTTEKRYSLSDATRSLLRDVEEEIKVKIYLDGELDADLTRLAHATADMVAEMNSYMSKPMSVSTFDPNDADSDEKRYATYDALERRGMRGMNISVRQRGGRLSEQVVFPWAEVYTARDTMQVCLMQPSGGVSAGEVVNAAIEDLEYRFIDAIRILTASQAKRVAFIEGHDELAEEYVYDVTDKLSRYFYVDRGIISNDASVLDPYAAIVIAGPKKAFSETDKFVIDQYIMRGGRVLWLIDGTQMSADMLSQSGATPIIANDVKLSDMLFRYGVRITPSVLEDMQCAYVPVNVARPGDEPRFEPIPWFYTPLLQTSPFHPITKSVGTVKADFASGIEVVGDTTDISKSLLLITSNATHVGFAPNAIRVGEAIEVEPQIYFTKHHVPVAVALEGKFQSIYDHRMPPEGVIHRGVVSKSVDTRMVVVADADIIKNEVEKHPEGLLMVPLGYDRVARRSYSNSEFIVNTLLYLTDDEGLMQLRNKNLKLRLINRAVVDSNRDAIIAVAVVSPLLLLALFAVGFLLARRRYYKA